MTQEHSYPPQRDPRIIGPDAKCSRESGGKNTSSSKLIYQLIRTINKQLWWKDHKYDDKNVLKKQCVVIDTTFFFFFFSPKGLGLVSTFVETHQPPRFFWWHGQNYAVCCSVQTIKERDASERLNVLITYHRHIKHHLLPHLCLGISTIFADSVSFHIAPSLSVNQLLAYLNCRCSFMESPSEYLTSLQTWCKWVCSNSRRNISVLKVLVGTCLYRAFSLKAYFYHLHKLKTLF